MKDEQKGEFPSKWDLVEGNAEIAEINGEKVLAIVGFSYITPLFKDKTAKYLPDEFTLEFDFFIDDKEGENAVEFENTDGESIASSLFWKDNTRFLFNWKSSGNEKTSEETVTISFEKGEIKAINGQKNDDKIALINQLEAIASKFGIGRDMHIGDTIIGIKGRVGFEAAAPLLIINAHKMLEKHTLTKWQQYWKDQLGNWYGMFLHEAQYLEPVMRDIEQFLQSSQQNVTGTVIVKLRPYNYTLVGVESSFDLMKTDFGEYGEVNRAWSADDVKGFTKILGNQMKIYYNVQKRNEK